MSTVPLALIELLQRATEIKDYQPTPAEHYLIANCLANDWHVAATAVDNGMAIDDATMEGLRIKLQLAQVHATLALYREDNKSDGWGPPR